MTFLAIYNNVDYNPGYNSATIAHVRIVNQRPTSTNQPLLIKLTNQTIEATLNALEDLKNWPDNWDSYGSVKPLVSAIENANIFSQKLFNLTSESGHQWTPPHISADHNGEVLLEWWHKNKSLALYVSSSEINYIKAYNANMKDMKDGCLQDINASTYRDLFEWLNTDELRNAA